jgi:hypothetical protein
MKAGILQQEAEFLTRRIAAAFGVEEWEHIAGEFRPLHFKARTSDPRIYIRWEMYGEPIAFESALLSFGEESCCVQYDAHYRAWTIDNEGKIPLELMAKSLYRLGFENENVSSQLPELSAHQKLELRLSLPREFWPPKWLEEEHK